ncbi:hypothetical protein EMIT0180MI3_340002 [Priestia megaterium]
MLETPSLLVFCLRYNFYPCYCLIAALFKNKKYILLKNI